MRQLPAILFLMVMVFNLFGYRLVIDCMRQQQVLQTEKDIDRQQYSAADLVSVKTALHLPYYTPSPEFERAYGTVNINGVEYRYVMRRVINDTLELLCLPDRKSTGLQAAANACLEQTLDGRTAPGSKPVQVKISLPEFFEEQQTPLLQPLIVAVPQICRALSGVPSDGCPSLHERPPDAARHA